MSRYMKVANTRAYGRSWSWHRAKRAGGVVKALLAPAPVGAEFTLARVGRAYSATYRKNGGGTWDQTRAAEQPLVINMSAEHLGFAVGERAVREAVTW